MLRKIIMCFISAGLLILSFPRTDLSFFVWIGLIPLMLALDRKDDFAGAFKTAYLCGFIFFSGTLYWFIHVTMPGAFLLIVYFSVYFGLFGIGYKLFSKKSVLQKIFLIPSVWVILEFARSRLFTGFDWVSLGHSQYKNLFLIQSADITGVSGITFLIVMVNVLLKDCIEKIKNKIKLNTAAIFIVSFVFLANIGYGFYSLNNLPKKTGSLKVAAIQANIGQEEKWFKPAWPGIMETYMKLTNEAVSSDSGIDLIIWPETSFPGMIGEDDELLDDLKSYVRTIKIPLLFGSVVKSGENYFNSAVLIGKDKGISEQYDKIHLVPFGEYVPFRKYYSYLADFIPIGDFTEGKDSFVFSSLGADKKFNCLICFEDTISYLPKTFLDKGSNLFINITNDGWFRDSKEPFLHLQSSLFRAVEYRRSLVRSANTGVSCVIGPQGKILKYVSDDKNKKTYITGFFAHDVGLYDTKTFYSKHGDVIPYFSFIYVLLSIALIKINKT